MSTEGLSLLSLTRKVGRIIPVPKRLQPLVAVAGLTWKAAFRFKLFWVLCGLLIASVVLLPLLLKDDKSARGFIQLMLTYNLSIITALLGLSTLWLACGSLARDIEDCQMQVVAVKPIPRWQIWLGKWLGIMALNVSLLTFAGTSVYVLLQLRARNLPPAQQAILQNEIFVARGSLKEPMPDIEAAVEREYQARARNTQLSAENERELKNLLREQLKMGVQVVPTGVPRQWQLDLGLRRHTLRDQPLYVRVKFHAAQTNASGTYMGVWGAVRDKAVVWRERKYLAPNTFHEFPIPPNMFDANGKLPIFFVNEEPSALLFPLEDGFELLYREGGFGLNFTRGLGIILFWLGLLAALGLAAASLLSFPVAAFFSGTLLMIALSGNTLSSVVSEGSVFGANHESGEVSGSWIDAIIIPFFKGLLKLVETVQGYSPVDALSTGRSITWGQLGQAGLVIVLLFGGFFAVIGMIIFTRRELAAAQGTH